MKLSTIYGKEIVISHIPDLSGIPDVNKERIQKWIKALRSGDFLQFEGGLKGTRRSGETGYCCLGVAADISEAGEWLPHNYYGAKDASLDGIDGGDPQSAVLPRCVREFYQLPEVFGFDVNIETFHEYISTTISSIAGLNDNGVSFKDISDVIETAINGGYIKEKENASA